MYTKTRIFLSLCLLIILTGCITQIDPALPYTSLPEIETALDIDLLLSPSHPKSKANNGTVQRGARVQVIGTDKDGGWFLVRHKDSVGWMHLFQSRNFMGNFKPAIMIDTLTEDCTDYLDSTTGIDTTWRSTTQGEAIIQGSILYDPTQTSLSSASLSLDIQGAGVVVQSDYVHVPLTPGGTNSATSATSLILFSFWLENLNTASTLAFDLTGVAGTLDSFQTAYFSNSCAYEFRSVAQAFTDQLPIGTTKTRFGEVKPITAPSGRTPTATRRATSTRPSATRVTSTRTPSVNPTRTRIIKVTSSSHISNGTRNAIKRVVERWDTIHHQSNERSDASQLATVLTGTALEDQRNGIQYNLDRGCFWRFRDLAPSEIVKWRRLSATEITVDVEKHWDADYYCNGVLNQAASFDEPFTAHYLLVRQSTWMIAEKSVLSTDEATPSPRQTKSSPATLTPTPYRSVSLPPTPIPPTRVPPTRVPPTKVPPTPRPIQPLVSNVHHFTGQQGVYGWSYQVETGRNSGVFKNFDYFAAYNPGDGSHTRNCWQTAQEGHVRICEGGEVHPGATGRIAYRWQSDHNRYVNVNVHAHKIDTNCGDGVWVGVFKVPNNQPPQKHYEFRIRGGDARDRPANTYAVPISLNAWDAVLVMVDIHRDSACDMTRLYVDVY
ncbi:MAG: IMS domain-containing protein [Chloroflexota bacterium]